MAFPIDKNKEMLKWGPIDGRLIYPDYFTVAFALFPKAGYFSWPNLLGLFRKGKMTYIGDMEELRKKGGLNFKKYFLPKKQRTTHYTIWKKGVKKLLQIQKQITEPKLKKLTNKALFNLYDEWSKQYLTFWTVGALPELSGWGGEAMLKQNLEKSFSGETFVNIFEKLSAPEKLSFYQKADLELYTLKKYRGETLEKKLKNHQQKYFWMLNSYSHSKILTVPCFKNQLTKISSIQATKKAKELTNLPKEVKKQKHQIVKKYRVNRRLLDLARALAFGINWQDERKYYIFLANHIIDIFLKEIAKRYNLNFDSLHNYSHKDIHRLLKSGKILPKTETKKRKLALVTEYLKKTNSLKYLSGRPAKKIIGHYLKSARKKGTQALTGIVVSKGPAVTGKVRIILSAKEAGKMKQGEILVTTMTSPDFIVAMKKAKGIVTDSGGITSHAAIVSRELKIPCIVGTEYATQTLKNGQKIRMDTRRGKIIRL